MYEFLLVACALVALVAVGTVLRAVVFAFSRVSFVRKVAASILALATTSVAVVLFGCVSETYGFTSRVDVVRLVIFSLMGFMVIVTGCTFIVSMRHGGILTSVQRKLLTVCPSLLWALLWVGMWYGVASLALPFFGRTFVVAMTPTFLAGLGFLIFVREYIGNQFNVEAKMAEVYTFYGSKRTGDAAYEGFNDVPGILPLFVQVTVYAVFRFSVFWGLTRSFVVAPIMVSGTFVVYSSDRKAIVIEAGLVLKISNPATFDDMVNDTSSEPREQVRDFATEVFRRAASTVFRRFSWQRVAEGSGFTEHLKKELVPQMTALGLSTHKVQVTFIGFSTPELQTMFQSWAGRDIRLVNQTVKEREVSRILQNLKQIDIASTYEDALHIWEAFNQEGRGSFRLLS